MNKKLLLMCTLFISIMPLSAQLYQHGLLLNVNKGRVDLKIDRWHESEYKYGFSAGYRLRFKEPEARSFHYDIDMNAGMKILRNTSYHQDPGYGLSSYGATSHKYYTSIGGTANYSIIKNLSAGLGIEPTYYFYPGKLDIPVVAKIACNFKMIGFEISGRYGLMDVHVLKSEDGMQSGKFRDIQCTLFIPF